MFEQDAQKEMTGLRIEIARRLVVLRRLEQQQANLVTGASEGAGAGASAAVAVQPVPKPKKARKGAALPSSLPSPLLEFLQTKKEEEEETKIQTRLGQHPAATAATATTAAAAAAAATITTTTTTTATRQQLHPHEKGNRKASLAESVALMTPPAEKNVPPAPALAPAPLPHGSSSSPLFDGEGAGGGGGGEGSQQRQNPPQSAEADVIEEAREALKRCWLRLFHCASHFPEQSVKSRLGALVLLGAIADRAADDVERERKRVAGVKKGNHEHSPPTTQLDTAVDTLNDETAARGRRYIPTVGGYMPPYSFYFSNLSRPTCNC